jgi:hypothetical protein
VRLQRWSDGGGGGDSDELKHEGELEHEGQKLDRVGTKLEARRRRAKKRGR